MDSQHAASGARIVLWVHNEHIGRIRTGYRRMGAYLDEWYGRDYIPIGFALDHGEYLAFDRGTASVGRRRVIPAEPGSYEHVFARAAMPRFIVDLRTARSGDPASAWLPSAKCSIWSCSWPKRLPRRIGAKAPICHL
jgi:erythromycin esterase